MRSTNVSSRARHERFHAAAALVAAALAPAATASAVGLTLAESPGPGTSVIDLTGFQTTGADMGGNLSVTAFFPGGSSETIPWLAGGGPGAGAATGTGWVLAEAGDTYRPGAGTSSSPGDWVLDVTGPNVTLDRLLLVGVMPVTAGSQKTGVAFDRTFADAFGTGGSFLGVDFATDPSTTGLYDLVVTYQNAIDNLADGAGAFGDLFGQLEIDFVRQVTGGGGVFGVNDSLAFRQDTDLVGDRLPGNPGGGEFPEPTGTAVALGAFAAYGLSRKRR